jgi:hypothetical protein
MEALQGALIEILTPLLLTLVTVVVGYLGVTMRNFLKNKRVKAFIERVRTEHEWIYDAAVNFALVAEEHVADTATNFADNDRYEYVRDKVLKQLNNLSDRAGVPLNIGSQELDALVRKAILAAQQAYAEAQSPAPSQASVPNVNAPQAYRVPGGTGAKRIL